jgi:serine phosphatase RsbU (regulator of sigma subunit)
VAGDFYDVLSDGQGLGVLIADVSGHGVPAALSASMMKVALRAQAEQMASPAGVLTGLNRTLSGLLGNQFITAAYVYFDTVRRELRYTGAGHPPVLLWRSGAKKVDALEENGLFLGPFPGAEYASLCTAFEPGDRCLLYTDGLVEASNRKDEEFGAERLSEFLARSFGLEPNAACSALLDQVTAWLGGEMESQQDDITFVLVEFRPAEVDASS